MVEFKKVIKNTSIAVLGAILLYAGAKGILNSNSENVAIYHRVPPYYKHIERRLEALEANSPAANEISITPLDYSLLATSLLAAAGVGYLLGRRKRPAILPDNQTTTYP